MEVFGMAGLFGLILGFMFGVGAAAVIYTVYMEGYRKAISDSHLDGETKRYTENLFKVRKKLVSDQVKLI